MRSQPAQRVEPARRPGVLVCAALPFGYGPCAKLLTLARALKGSAELVFVGRGAALELAGREGASFDRVCQAPEGSDVLAGEVRRASAVLSLMDREAAAVAVGLGRPLYVVDSLLWMRSAVPEAFRGAAGYFAQVFPGAQARPWAPGVTWVGPILERGPALAPSSRGGLVLHLGGSAAPDDRKELYDAYARLALRAVLSAGLLERFASLTLLGGQRALAATETVTNDGRIRRLPATPLEARDQIAHAAAVVTSPGLTAVLECFASRTPTWFLPPQNASQWILLSAFRQHGLGVTALHFEDLGGPVRVGWRLDEAVSDERVPLAIAKALRDPGTLTALAESLKPVALDAHEQVATQDRFVAMLGPPGTDAVVAALRAALAGDGARP